MYVYIDIITLVYQRPECLQLIESVYHHRVDFIEELKVHFVICFYHLAMPCQ